MAPRPHSFAAIPLSTRSRELWRPHAASLQSSSAPYTGADRRIAHIPLFSRIWAIQTHFIETNEAPAEAPTLPSFRTATYSMTSPLSRRSCSTSSLPPVLAKGKKCSGEQIRIHRSGGHDGNALQGQRNGIPRLWVQKMVISKMPYWRVIKSNFSIMSTPPKKSGFSNMMAISISWTPTLWNGKTITTT